MMKWIRQIDHTDVLWGAVLVGGWMLNADNEALRAQIAEMEREDGNCRREHAWCESARDELQAQIRDLLGRVDKLEVEDLALPGKDTWGGGELSDGGSNSIQPTTQYNDCLDRGGPAWGLGDMCDLRWDGVSSHCALASHRHSDTQMSAVPIYNSNASVWNTSNSIPFALP